MANKDDHVTIIKAGEIYSRATNMSSLVAREIVKFFCIKATTPVWDFIYGTSLPMYLLYAIILVVVTIMGIVLLCIMNRDMNYETDMTECKHNARTALTDPHGDEEGRTSGTTAPRVGTVAPHPGQAGTVVADAHTDQLLRTTARHLLPSWGSSCPPYQYSY